MYWFFTFRNEQELGLMELGRVGENESVPRLVEMLVRDMVIGASASYPSHRRMDSSATEAEGQRAFFV